MGSTKNALKSFHAIIDGDMSGNLTSPVTNILLLDNISVQLVWTGTPTGDFEVQGSLNEIAWEALPLSPAPAAAGAADQALIDMNQLSYPFIRVVYTATSGTGVLNMWISGRGV